MVEKILAATVALVCVLMLVRMALPERFRWRLDATARDAWATLAGSVLRVWRWRASRKSAARLTDEVIQKARDGVERDGNVYRPTFGGPRDSKEPRTGTGGGNRKPH
jgi:uncharacterized membrane protein YqjE